MPVALTIRLLRSPWRTGAIGLTCLAVVTVSGWYWGGWRQPSTIELRELCSQASQKQQWTALEEQAKRWTKFDPQSGEAWMHLARALEQQQKFEQAADSLASVPKSALESESALIARMELAFGPRNRPLEGAEICQQILKRRPRSSTAQQRLIFFLTMTLQRSRLTRRIRAALESGTESREDYVYLFFADSQYFSNGASWNGQWLAGDPESELFEVAEAVFISQTLDAGVSMDDREQAQIARRALALKQQVLEKLLKKYPHNAELLALHLRESVKTGDVGRVVELLSQAPVEAEEDNRFWRYKGWVLAQRGEFAQAEKDYRRAIELHPLDWGTRHLLAELLQRQQRFEEAERLHDLVDRANVLRRALQTAPSARQVLPETLAQLASYADDCDDDLMAVALRRRIRQFSSENPQMPLIDGKGRGSQ